MESELSELSTRPSAEDLASSTERTAKLEAHIAALESELSELSTRPTAEDLASSTERAAELEARLAALESELSELSTRPTAEDLASSTERAAELEAHIAALESELSELSTRPTAEELESSIKRAAELEAQIEVLNSELVELSARPTAEDLATSVELASELESRIAILQEETVRLTERPTLEDFQAQKERAETLEAALEQLRADSDAAAEMAVEATALRDQLAQMQSLLKELDERPEPGELDDARDRIAELEDELVAIKARLAAASEAQVEVFNDERAGLLSALAAMETELATLKRREEETMTTARTLLVEMETHRTYEAAQATALSQARNEAARLQDALMERQQQIATLGAALATAEAARDELAAAEAEVRTDGASIENLNLAVMRLEEEKEALEAKSEAADHAIATLEGQVAELTRNYEALETFHKEVAARCDNAEAALAGASVQERALAAATSEIHQKEAALEALESEKELLSTESRIRKDEIGEAMAQMSQVLHERDELSEELENEKARRERLFAGSAGAGKSALEALESREERVRQQEILLSELTQTGESRTLGDILVDAGILTRGQLSDALDDQQNDPTQLLGTILIEKEYTTDDAIAQAVACQLEKPVVNPMEVHVQKEALDALHRDLCTWHVCIPLRITEDRLVVAMANPLDESAILKLRDVSQREITPVVGTPSHIMGAIDNYYGTF